MKMRFNIDPIYYLIITTIFVIGYYLGAWSGYLKGDDVYWHLSIIKFISDNFPNIFWYPYNYLGYDLFPKYPYLSYIIIALIYKLTSIELETIFEIVFFVSLSLLGMSFFRLSKLLNIQRLDGFALSLLIFTVPAFWNISIFGGAYIRIFALPFIIFSIIYSIEHINIIEEKKNDKFASIKIIALLSLTAYLHPRLWLFTAITIIFLYIFGIDGISIKIKKLFIIFAPIATITLPVYAPYLTGNTELTLHDYTPNTIRGLFTMSESTNLTLNPLYAYLTIFIIFYILILLSKYMRGETIKYKRSNMALLVTSLLFSLYHLLFGWFSMPKSLYIISAYNSADWLALFLTLFILSSYAIFRDNFIEKKSPKFNDIGILLIVLVIFQLLFTLPLVKERFISYTAPEDLSSITYDLNPFIKNYNDSMKDGYRLAITHRTFTRWINYLYPEMEITGGRLEPLQPNKEFQDWFTDSVFYRFDRRKFGQMYIDDIPKILPEYGFLDNKSINPSLWLLDWTGSNNVIIYPNIMSNRETLLEYLKRPQIFDIEKGKTRFGEIYRFEYNESSPIMTMDNVPVLGIFSDSQNDQLYLKILMILSYINADSKIIIPIKIDINDIRSDKFDRLLTTDELYENNKKDLIKYVKNGGTLIIINKYRVNANILKYETENIEKGKIIWTNASIDNIFNTQDFMMVNNFVKLLNPLLDIKNKEINNKWNISYITGDIPGEIYELDDKNAILKYTIDSYLQHNQINIQVPIEELSTNSSDIINIEIYSDNWKNVYADMVLINDKYNEGFLYYPLKLKSENVKGWKMFSIPVTGFKVKGHYGPLLKNVNIIEIAINEDYPYNSKETTVMLKNGIISVINNNKNIIEPKYSRENPQEVIIELKNRSDGILYRETFSKNWRTYITRNNKIEYLPIYFAGPGFIYIDTRDIEYPVNVALSYNLEIY